MAENSSTLLTFVRTDDNGDLTLRNPLTNETFVMEVSDELEQGILAAKQIKKDAEGTPLPQNEKALPISMIQSLIRAGHTPEEIQCEHGVSAALVRRFAGPVETEKKFAIAQFLDNLVPGDQNAAKISEVIKTTTASIGADYEEVEWDASREGHNPWLIEAIYTSRENTETAQWTFNPRDHSVVCVNTPAKRLLGEISDTTSPVDQSLFSTDSVPIVTAAPATHNSAVATHTGSFADVSVASIHGENRLSTDAFNAIVQHDAEQPESFEPHIKRAQSATEKTTPDQAAADTNSHVSTENVPVVNPDSVQPNEYEPSEQESAQKPQKQTSAKRMRSSIPAWDDILFGSN